MKNIILFSNLCIITMLSLTGCGSSDDNATQSISSNIPATMQVGVTRDYQVKYNNGGTANSLTETVQLSIADNTYNCQENGKALEFNKDQFNVTVNDSIGTAIEITTPRESLFCKHQIVITKQGQSTSSTLIASSSDSESTTTNTSVVSTFYVGSKSKQRIYNCSTNYETGSPVVQCNSYFDIPNNDNPRGMAFDPTNNDSLYVATTDNTNIYQCSISTQSCTQYSDVSDSGFPYDVAFTDSGSEVFLYYVNNDDGGLEADTGAVYSFNLESSSTTPTSVNNDGTLITSHSQNNLTFAQLSSGSTIGYLVNNTADKDTEAIQVCDVDTSSSDFSNCTVALDSNAFPGDNNAAEAIFDLAINPLNTEYAFVTLNYNQIGVCNTNLDSNGELSSCGVTDASLLDNPYDMAFDPYNQSYIYVTNNNSKDNPVTVCQVSGSSISNCNNNGVGSDIKNAYGIAFYHDASSS